MRYLDRWSSDRRWLSRRRLYSQRLAVAAIIAVLCLAIILLFESFVLFRQHSGVQVESAVLLHAWSGLGKRSACDEAKAKGKHDQTIKNLLPHDGNVHTVPRAANASVYSRTRVSIPQMIWQTARSHNDTPPLGIDLFNSWTSFNQGYDHFFLDDAEVLEFVQEHYNQSVVDAFKAMPLGVMRADAVRYMLVYHYGGVYADMDTECLAPIEAWAPRGCHLTVALENAKHFCQWAFAAVAGHPALGSVLDLVLHRMLAADYRDRNATDEHFVHHITGPEVFTEGVLRYLRLPFGGGDLEDLQAAQHVQLRARGVCLLTQAELEGSLVNLYSSQREDLQSGTWQSWTEERAAYLGIAPGGDRGAAAPAPAP